VARARAERQADADLPALLADGVRDDAVDAERGESSAETPNRPTSSMANLRDAFCRSISDSSGRTAYSGRSGSTPLRSAGEQVGGVLPRSRLDHNGDGEARLLPHRSVHLRRHRAVEPVAVDVADDADDGDPGDRRGARRLAAGANHLTEPLADGVLPGPVRARHRLVDDDSPRVLLVVLLDGQPAANERNARVAKYSPATNDARAVATSVDSSGQPRP
jgi:hypothetical protein